MGRTARRGGIEAAIEARGADIYAGFFLPHLRPDMVILDCGCGEATISIGLSEAVPAGRVVGVDLDKHDIATARRYAASTERGNLVLAVRHARPAGH